MKLSNSAMLDVMIHIRDKVPFTGEYIEIDPAAVETKQSREDIAHALYSLIKGDVLHGIVSKPLDKDPGQGAGVRYRVAAITLYGQQYYEQLRLR